MENKFLSLPAIFTFLVFILMLLKIWLKSKRKQSAKNLPPGPWKLPLIGHLHLFLFSPPHHQMKKLAEKHGPLMHLKFGELPLIVVSSSELAQEVMKTHDINFANRPPMHMGRVVLYNLTDMAWSPYGAYWRLLRKICATELLGPKRVQAFRPIREEQVSNFISLISSNVGLPINLGEMIYNLSYSITCRAAFSGRGKQHDAIRSLMKTVTVEAGGFPLADLFPSFKFLYVITGLKRRLERLHHDLDEIFQSIIEEHKAKKLANCDNDQKDDDLVDVLLNLQDRGDPELFLTNDNIKAVILDMFVAGIETSSTALEWAMSELIRNPRVMEKAQAEVRQVFGRTGNVCESNIHELKYLNLVIKETLRLHPSAPLLLPRENIERCELNGYEIPEKSRVFINAWAIGRDPNYWNEAERFYPERFLNSLLDYKGTNFEYIPFGAGRRICPGMLYGLSSVELSLANLLYHFDWKLPNGLKHEDLDMSEAGGTTFGRKKPLFLIPIPYLAP